jgi:hypothetical protein
LTCPTKQMSNCMLWLIYFNSLSYTVNSWYNKLLWNLETCSWLFEYWVFNAQPYLVH